MQNPGPDRPLSPHLQIYRPMYTMVLSILHRAAGIWLSVAGLLLAGWLVAVARGPAAYETAGRLLGSLPGRIAIAAAIAAFWYHCFAGLRHLAWDAGYGFDRPVARASGWAVLLLAIAATVATIACRWQWFAGPA